MRSCVILLFLCLLAILKPVDTLAEGGLRCSGLFEKKAITDEVTPLNWRATRVDKRGVIVVEPAMRGDYVIGFGSSGLLSYTFRNKFATRNAEKETDEFLVVWEWTGTMPGRMYGAYERLPEVAHKEGYFKHSSFLGPVAATSAWTMKVNSWGKILEIREDSGHYFPNAWTMYLTIKELRRMGADMSGVDIVFPYGFKVVKNIRLDIESFEQAMKSMSSELRKIYFVPGKQNPPELLDYLFDYMSDPYSRSLVSLWRLRHLKEREDSKPHLNEIAKYLDSATEVKQHVPFFLEFIFTNKRYRHNFAHFEENAYMNRYGIDMQTQLISLGKDQMLSVMADPQMMLLVEKWAPRP